MIINSTGPNYCLAFPINSPQSASINYTPSQGIKRLEPFLEHTGREARYTQSITGLLNKEAQPLTLQFEVSTLYTCLWTAGGKPGEDQQTEPPYRWHISITILYILCYTSTVIYCCIAYFYSHCVLYAYSLILCPILVTLIWSDRHRGLIRRDIKHKIKHHSCTLIKCCPWDFRAPLLVL